MKFRLRAVETPESVNQALHEAVTKIQWNKSKKVLKLVFLVGDAPPHMDYQDEIKYPEICKMAAKSNIILNTVQCGDMSSTTPIWKEIAKLAEGDYVAIAQSGGVAAISTPVDAEIAKLNRELGVTVVAYGRAEVRISWVKSRSSPLRPRTRWPPTDSPFFRSSQKHQRPREFFLLRVAAYIDGDGDLVAGLASGKYDYEEIEEAKLSDELKKMDPEQRTAYLKEQVAKRAELQKKLTNSSPSAGIS